MPNCFMLLDKVTGDPEKLQVVDDKMREHFGAPPDPKEWYESWYLLIGLPIAMGKDWEWCREQYPQEVEIIDWLEANYTSDAWYEHR